jgi:hypothetical protein
MKVTELVVQLDFFSFQVGHLKTIISKLNAKVILLHIKIEVIKTISIKIIKKLNRIL